MKKGRTITTLVAGIIVGATLTGPAATAAENWLRATPSTQQFFVDGRRVDLEAYAIGGNNYVKLRDIGKAVDFGVEYDAVTNSVWIGDAHAGDGTVTLPTDGSQYVPQAGDVILCDDGYEYTITDVSRWDGNAFANRKSVV